MSDKEMILVYGGFSTTLLNSLARILTVVFNIGKSVGTSIRMIRQKQNVSYKMIFFDIIVKGAINMDSNIKKY